MNEMLLLNIVAVAIATEVIHLAHVPKTGGTFLYFALNKCKIPCKQAEKPMFESPRIALLRDPMQHIPSMYAHCRAGKYMNHTQIPRGDNVSHGFNLWLDAAIANRERKGTLHFGFLSCYQPWEFQTTFFPHLLKFFLKAILIFVNLLFFRLQ